MDNLILKEYAIYMRIKPIHLKNKNQLVNDYRNEQSDIHTFFDYKPFDPKEDRLADLKGRSFKREDLTRILHRMNTNWDAPRETLQQIERLKEKNSVVVIGGQQAGLLTGPMYTINKIISILTLAKEKEKKLNIPVIPVFWIAGEDHDYDEINHIHSNRGNQLYKHTTKQELYLKQSVSSVEIDQDKTLQWIKQAFYDLKETKYSKTLYESTVSCLRKSTSYVDFFARLLLQLFPEQGLVLIDSGHPEVRQLESEAFKRFITHQPEISKAVYETVQKLQQKGYAISLEVEEDDAHLFYHDINNERILLKRSDDLWVGKNDEIELTTEQLITIAEEQPEKLSNNVVTRPIMQECLFPTLAFVGGDGEISYWAALKRAFRAFDENMKVPPVLPRLSFTYVTKRIEKLLNVRVLEPEYILNHDIEVLKLNWLLAQQTPPVETIFREVNENINKLHFPLRKLATSISADLHNEAEKNLAFIHSHLAHLEHKTIKKLEEKHEHELAQYDEIKSHLKPNELLQERVWSPLFFLNEYGLKFIKEMMGEQLFSCENNHYLIYMD